MGVKNSFVSGKHLRLQRYGIHIRSRIALKVGVMYNIESHTLLLHVRVVEGGSEVLRGCATTLLHLSLLVGDTSL